MLCDTLQMLNLLFKNYGGPNNVKKSKNIVYWIFYCDSLKMFDSRNMNPNFSEYNLKKRRKMAKTEFF